MTPNNNPTVFYKTAPWLSLLLAAAAGAAFRYYLMDNLAPREFSYFIESCIRFRYAEMRMLGFPVPASDPWVLWPEGFPVATMILSLPDHITAAYYHLTGGGDTYLSSRNLINLLSATAVLAFIPLALAVLRRPWPAAAATLLYAGTFAAFGRSFGNYLREDFALPGLLIVTAAAYYLLTIKETGCGRWFWGAVAAGAAFWGSASWHLSQFYFAALGGMLVFAAFAGKTSGAAFAAAATWLGFAAAAVSQTPLWAKGALWGPASALLAAPAVGYGVARLARRPGASHWLTGAAAAVLVAGAAIVSRSGGYDHVYALVWAKLVHLGIKPDPVALPSDARLFWVGPYESPSPLQLWLDFGPLLLGAGAAAWWVSRDASRGQANDVALALAPAAVFAALYGLMNRLSIFWAPWVAILNTYLVMRVRGRSLAVAGAALLALWVLHLYGIWDYAYPGRYHNLLERVFQPRAATPWYYGSERPRFLATLAQDTPPGAVLADFSVSPQIMYLGGHPIALNPMFEVPQVRRKTWAYINAATENEEVLYNLCRKWRIRYVVHFAPQVLARDAGTFYNATGHPVARTSAAGMMQFEPQGLKRFRLRYETYSVRLFEVGVPYDGYRSPAYHPLFDPNRFPDVPSPRKLEDFYRDFYRADIFYRQGLAATARGDAVGAAAAFTSCLRLHPDYEDADLFLGQALLATGQREAARAALERYTHAYPSDSRAARLLNLINNQPNRRRGTDPYG